MTTSRASRRIVLPTVLASAALVLAGCSTGTFESTPQDTVYCVDQDNRIVDEQQCADQARTQHHSSGIGTAVLFYMIGRYSGGLQPGTRLDPGQSTSRFQTTDTAARSAAGLSKSGTVHNGTSAATGRPAGLGSKSGHGSGGKPGGFGGGHSGG